MTRDLEIRWDSRDGIQDLLAPITKYLTILVVLDKASLNIYHVHLASICVSDFVPVPHDVR